jgi:succinylglutamate desuccinylase
VHGDEVGSLPAVVDLVEALNDGTTSFGGRLTIFLGNPEASAADVRFLEADLNRVFVEEPPANHEGHRARELKPILDAADVFVDLHQTIEPTDRPFYIFPFGIAGWHWARAIGGPTTWVTRAPTASFSTGTCGTDEYVRLANKPGLTIELGPKGFNPQSIERAEAALQRLLATADVVGADPDALAQRAEAGPDLTFLHTVWSQPFDDPHLALRPGLSNFAPVEAGDRLSAEATPPVDAPVSGMVLFPKYPRYNTTGEVLEPRPGEIVRIVAPMTGHPIEVWADEL